MAKKKKASLKAVKPRKEEGKTNLFESIYNKKKFDILGQKSKATPKKRGQARKEGIEKVLQILVHQRMIKYSGLRYEWFINLTGQVIEFDTVIAGVLLHFAMTSCHLHASVVVLPADGPWSKRVLSCPRSISHQVCTLPVSVILPAGAFTGSLMLVTSPSALCLNQHFINGREYCLI